MFFDAKPENGQYHVHHFNFFGNRENVPSETLLFQLPKMLILLCIVNILQRKTL